MSGVSGILVVLTLARECVRDELLDGWIHLRAFPLDHAGIRLNLRAGKLEEVVEIDRSFAEPPSRVAEPTAAIAG
jgi:hypothetical protein